MHTILDSFLRFFGVIAWPLVVLILFLVFKGNISELIKRIRFFKYNDRVISFDQESLEEDKSPRKGSRRKNKDVKAISPVLSLGKPATLFWLANDLMWAQDWLFRNAPSKKIIQGLKYIHDYVLDLGLKGSQVDVELSRLIQDSEATLINISPEWSPEYRLALVQQIENIKWTLASKVEENEPGFTKHRVFR